MKLTNLLEEIVRDLIAEKKLCPKGRAYYDRRRAAGEVPSAYLSGRAVQVCKGRIKEDDDSDLDESLRDWFEKEDWVRIDTAGNITGPCGTMKKGNATTRCLPRAKANSLSKEERASTSRKKANADKKGKRVVPNTEKAKVRLREDLSDTKIVDENNQPLVVYRSQEDDRTQGVDRQSDTKGIYFSANADSTKIYGPITKKYHLNIKNPLILKDKEWNLSILPSYYYDMLVKKGYDGAAWLRQGEMYEIIAFYPDQIVPVGDDSNEEEIDEYDVELDEEVRDFAQYIKEYVKQLSESELTEAEYQGRKVPLGKPMRGDIKKFKVYVKNPAGRVVKVNFGDPNMKIKKSNPKRRKSFRARHHCDTNPGPRTKARYWSCRKW